MIKIMQKETDIKEFEEHYFNLLLSVSVEEVISYITVIVGVVMYSVLHIL